MLTDKIFNILKNPLHKEIESIYKTYQVKDIKQVIYDYNRIYNYFKFHHDIPIEQMQSKVLENLKRYYGAYHGERKEKN